MEIGEKASIKQGYNVTGDIVNVVSALMLLIVLQFCHPNYSHLLWHNQEARTGKLRDQVELNVL